MDLANLFLHDVKVVDQPLGRRGDDAFLTDGLGDRAIRFEQHPAVVSQPCRQRPTSPGPRRDALSSREALAVLFEALDAEEFAADRLFGVPRGSRPPTREAAKD